jgi:hypothetical protein
MSGTPHLESIVRNLAQQHGRKLKLGNHNPKHVANAKRSFAKDMGDDEVPFVFLDRSFFGNGKAGLLITDRRVYSSTVSSSVALADIRIATAEVKSTAEVMLGGGTKDQTLFVNGAPFYTELATMGRKPLTFYAEVLNALANAVRQGTETSETPAKPALDPQTVSSPPTDSPVTLSAPGSGGPHRAGAELPEYVRIAAALVCADKPVDEAVRELGAVGVNEASARPLIEEMNKLRCGPRRQSAMLQLIGGLVLTPLAIGLSLITFNPHNQTYIVFGGLGSLGLLLAIVGGCRLLFGSPKLKTEELIRAWCDLQRSHGSPDHQGKSIGG